MSADPGKPALKSAVLQGPPGAGKSSFIRRYAYKWSLSNGGKDTEEQKKWDLVVVLPVSTLRLSPGKSPEDQLFEAIKDNLAGSEKEAVMKHIKTKQMKVLIIPDGLDECRSDTTMKMLIFLVEECNKNALPFSVFVTCRSGLCKIKQSVFDRRMKIDGFTVDQGIEYVKRYYAEIQKPDDDNILEYISNSQGKLDHILDNPLRTHILSVVTANGTLKLVEGQTLALKKLLGAMEVLMKERQLEKRKKAAETSQENFSEDDIEAQTNNFYKLSLYSLLKDIRVFDNDLLQKFNVFSTSPYFSFMKGNKRQDLIIRKVIEWHFTHEMFHEYFASCALQSLPLDDLEYFLIHICSSPGYRNTQRILFSALGADLDHAHLLADMLKATILLQCEEEISDISEMVGSITEGTDPLEIILSEEKASVLDDTGSKDERASTVAKLWKDIRSYFKNKAVTSRDIFVHMHQDTHLLSHIYACLREVPEENQQRLFDNSIGCLLQANEDSTTWYATNKTQFSNIKENKYGPAILSWSPVDALQLIKQHGQPYHPDWTTQHDDTDQQEPQQTQVVIRQDTGADGRNWATTGIRHVRRIDVHIPSAGEKTSYSAYSGCWGAPPAEQLLSPQAWSEMLGEMSRQWRIRADCLNIMWDESCPISVKGLLDALLLEDTQHYLKQLLVEQEGGWRDVGVWNGNIDSSDLCEWTRRYTQQSVVRVELNNLTCKMRHINDSAGVDVDAADQKDTGGKKILHYEASGEWFMTSNETWSTIGDDYRGLSIHSWSLDDACQHIQQHVLPHQYKWQTDSIHINVPSVGGSKSYSDLCDCWGAPPAGQLLSPQAWSEMLSEMSRQWRIRADCLNIWWNESCPISVKGLLDALLLEDTQHYLKQLLVEQEGGWRDVGVWNGNIASSDLCEWTRRYTQQSVVRVVLTDLDCNISEDEGSSREDKEAAVRAQKNTVHGERWLFQTFSSRPPIVFY